jgi:hypothetical protein
MAVWSPALGGWLWQLLDCSRLSDVVGDLHGGRREAMLVKDHSLLL